MPPLCLVGQSVVARSDADHGLSGYFEDVDGDVGSFMQRFVDFLVSSEDAGFDMLFANEHHFDAYGGIIPSPTVMVAALAQRTKCVQLGSSIIVLPLHNPIEIAEQWGAVQGMGSVFREELVYDEAGQLCVGSLRDYGVPLADDYPHIHCISEENHPSTTNPLGAKGEAKAESSRLAARS